MKGHLVNRTKKLSRASSIVLALTAFLTTALGATVAEASSQYPVSGTVYSDNSYFNSSTIRTFNGTTLQLALPSRPSRNIVWRLISVTYGTVFAGPTELTSGSNYTIATGVINGTRFENSYRQGYGSCLAFCNYNFSGTETY